MHKLTPSNGMNRQQKSKACNSMFEVDGRCLEKLEENVCSFETLTKLSSERMCNTEIEFN